MIEVYTGHFGSGKTEIVLNRALTMASRGKTVHVVDLDIVKPYFRSREARKLLEEAGVHLVIPNGGLNDADLPVVSPSILGALTSAQGEILIDLGGDPTGATALGSFAPLLHKLGCQMLFVLNPYRPFTQDLPGVRKMLQDIERSSRLKVNGLASNPNLGRETELEDLRKGYAQVRGMATDLGLPILLTAVTERWANELLEEIPIPIQTIRNYLLPPWELEDGQVNDRDPQVHFVGRRDVDA
ncbi:MAG: hypothetical protein ACYCVD_07025 [Desulfitobacteriaceae bacterium]